MTNPPTPEDKIDAILDSLDEYSDVYRSLDIAEKLTMWPQLSKARHALLALVNEARLNGAIQEMEGIYAQTSLYSMHERYANDEDYSVKDRHSQLLDELAQLRATTPKEDL